MAYAGAETTGASPPGMLQQVGIYLTAFPDLHENALFIIWIGGNDFLNGSADYDASVANINTALGMLAGKGAENILILNLPNLGATPGLLGTPGAAAATQLTQAFNAALAAAVDTFEGAYPDITVYELDIYTFFENIIADPDSYGFTNATEVSPNSVVANNFDNSAGYVFWDSIHPTTEAHAEVANEAYALLPSDADDDDNDGGKSGLGCFIGSVFSFN
jgi:phospholipase/lecithinase/hemolysin